MVDAQGAPVEREGGGTFPTQSEAESWLGEEWRELLDSGVDAVTLREDGADVYGPMSLHGTE
ncbi:MAG: hypothetical protein M3Y71_16635 [Actinomycetota bacterium]|nr:hypothetical protein [Actinomycetota bacterium]